MASKSERRYATTIGTVVAVTEKMVLHYAEKTGCEWIKKELGEMRLLAWAYLAISNKMMQSGMDSKDLRAVDRAMNYMSERGLEDVRSYRTYLAFQLALLSERAEELDSVRGNSAKSYMVTDLLERTANVWEYFASRNKREDFDQDATKLLDLFNAQFA